MKIKKQDKRNAFLIFVSVFLSSTASLIIQKTDFGESPELFISI